MGSRRSVLARFWLLAIALAVALLAACGGSGEATQTPAAPLTLTIASISPDPVNVGGEVTVTFNATPGAAIGFQISDSQRKIVAQALVTAESDGTASFKQAIAGPTGAWRVQASAGRSTQDLLDLQAASPAAAPPGSLTINKPAGTVQGDALIASIAVRPRAATITAPAGWTLVRRIDNSAGSSNSLAVYYKVAGGSEPASYIWSFSAMTGSAGGIQAFTGVDTTNPIQVENGQTTASDLSHATASVTTTAANTMIVTTHSFSSSASWTPPAGMAEAFDVASNTVPSSGGISIEGNYLSQASAGSTGTKTATASNNPDVGDAHILALKPASGTSGISFRAASTSSSARPTPTSPTPTPATASASASFEVQ